MEGLELVAFQIISSVGGARSCYIQAIKEAREGNFEQASKLVEDGNNYFKEGHHAHADLVSKEAASTEKGDGGITPTLLLTHAEDQLMSAEAFKILSEEFLTLYKILREKEIL